MLPLNNIYRIKFRSQFEKPILSFFCLFLLLIRHFFFIYRQMMIRLSQTNDANNIDNGVVQHKHDYNKTRTQQTGKGQAYIINSAKPTLRHIVRFRDGQVEYEKGHQRTYKYNCIKFCNLHDVLIMIFLQF